MTVRKKIISSGFALLLMVFFCVTELQAINTSDDVKGWTYNLQPPKSVEEEIPTASDAVTKGISIRANSGISGIGDEYSGIRPKQSGAFEDLNNNRISIKVREKIELPGKTLPGDDSASLGSSAKGLSIGGFGRTGNGGTTGLGISRTSSAGSGSGSDSSGSRGIRIKH